MVPNSAFPLNVIETNPIYLQKHSKKKKKIKRFYKEQRTKILFIYLYIRFQKTTRAKRRAMFNKKRKN